MDSKEKKIIELDRAMEEPTFWDDPKESTKIVREAKQLKDTAEPSPVTGAQCFTECIQDGRLKKDTL